MNTDWLFTKYTVISFNIFHSKILYFIQNILYFKIQYISFKMQTKIQLWSVKFQQRFILKYDSGKASEFRSTNYM